MREPGSNMGSSSAPRRKIGVLVIDDSAHNRRAITQMLEAAADVEVLGRASDGEEGLRQAAELKPDVITLDLEMPKLDGFAFLRLLMAHVPTPVIVISSYAHKSDVFKALELGAFDFIAKPRLSGRVVLEGLRQELLEKVRSVRLVHRGEGLPPPEPTPVHGTVAAPAPTLIALGASTGGPPAIQKLLEAISPEPDVCLLVCQHMPPKFTEAFAERLDRIASFQVSEAKDGDLVLPGRAFIAPGGRQLVVERNGSGLRLRTPHPAKEDKHAPSVDRLFESMARSVGKDALGVVLTGMGSDGARGARALRDAGAEVWAEAESTAVIFGMPKEAIATGAVSRILGLHELGPALAAEVRKRRRVQA